MNRLLLRRRSGVYTNAVLALTPLGYWRLGERSGTVARDEMGLYHGTYVNTPTLGANGLIAGDDSPSILMIPASNTQVTASSAAIDAIESPTYLGWLNLDSLSSPATYFSGGHGAPSASVKGWRVGNTFSAGTIRLQISDGTNFVTNNVALSKVPAIGVTSMVAAVFDRAAGLASLYVDGVVRGTLSISSVTGTIAIASTPMILGNSAGWVVGGRFGEPALFNRAITAAEIADLYAIGRG